MPTELPPVPMQKCAEAAPRASVSLWCAAIHNGLIHPPAVILGFQGFTETL